MEFWIVINVLSHFFEKNVLITYTFKTQWQVGSLPIAVQYCTFCKKGLSKKPATPGSAFDRTTGGGDCTFSNVHIHLRSHGILKKWAWKSHGILFHDLRENPVSATCSSVSVLYRLWPQCREHGRCSWHQIQHTRWHGKFTQCCLNTGPASPQLAQHCLHRDALTCKRGTHIWIRYRSTDREFIMPYSLI